MNDVLLGAFMLAVGFVVGAVTGMLSTKRDADDATNADVAAASGDPYRDATTTPPPVAPSPSVPKKPPFIVGFALVQEENSTDVTCPKCDALFAWKVSPRYCECEDCDNGHFHLECSGGRPGGALTGCGFKWIMRERVKTTEPTEAKKDANPFTPVDGNPFSVSDKKN